MIDIVIESIGNKEVHLFRHTNFARSTPSLPCCSLIRPQPLCRCTEVPSEARAGVGSGRGGRSARSSTRPPPAGTASGSEAQSLFRSRSSSPCPQSRPPATSGPSRLHPGPLFGPGPYAATVTPAALRLVTVLWCDLVTVP